MSAPVITIEPYVASFCERVVPDQSPVFVTITPDKGARRSECYEAVEKRIEKHGGAKVYGWDILEWPGVFIESEFHCIWRSPDGNLLDVTPREIPFKRILFLPDPKRVYEGFQIDNVRLIRVNDPLVYRFIELAELLFQERNRGDLKYIHGEVAVRGAYAQYFQEKIQIEMQLMPKYGHAMIHSIQSNTWGPPHSA